VFVVSDVLGIISWKHTTFEGATTRRFRARGTGPTYIKFYEWLNTQTLGYQHDDWPWHSWSFVEPENDETIRLLWGEFFLSDDEDYVCTEAPAPVPTSLPMEDELSAILLEEINKEMLIQLHARATEVKKRLATFQRP
jgi:hypothetical protein